MLDHTDRQIIEELSKNSRMTMKELGEKVHLTGQAASSRVAKLEDQGVIEGYTIKVNQDKLGCFIHAFINIYTKSTYHKPYLS
ncbi:Lrp/AsnC family transcriptional regulator, partial [Lactiplantibacillus pentosus]